MCFSLSSTPFWDASREARVPSSSCKTMRATGAAKLSASAGLREGSVALLEQLRTIDKLRLRGRAGHIGAEQMRLVDAALAVSLGLKGPGDDFMLLTLCRKCHQTFCDSDDYLVWRADFEQEQREPCTICNPRTGYDYKVVRR